MSAARVFPWFVRVVWAVLPLVAGPAFADAFDDRSRAVQLVGSVGLWAAWAVVLCASLVLHPLSLTLVRAGAPAAALAAVAAGIGGAGTGATVVAFAAAVVASLVALLPEVAVAFVNGPAYPNERRFPLRAPGPLLLGPLQVAWAMCVATPAAAALLLASKQWVTGVLLVVVAAISIAILGRSLYALANRWLVFVPAGVVLHDPMTLADPMLFRRKDVASFDLAAADTDALDLTARAFGLAIELEVAEPVPLAMIETRARAPKPVTASKLLFAPTRPGAVITEARSRRLD
jgi:hypothetical protein